MSARNCVWCEAPRQLGKFFASVDGGLCSVSCAAALAEAIASTDRYEITAAGRVATRLAALPVDSPAGAA